MYNKYCPFISANHMRSCCSSECAMWSPQANQCLVKMALGTYIVNNGTSVLQMKDNVNTAKYKMEQVPDEQSSITPL